jgi:hypothetical protein
MKLRKQNNAIDQLTKQRDGVFARFPLVFTLLGTFGVTTTYYGFQHIIDKIPFFANDPYLTLVVGLTVLILTGTLYKKLG